MINLKFNYPVYPVYYFSFIWSQPIDQSERLLEDIPEKWLLDQPEGYFKNSNGFSKMFKEDPTQVEIDSIVSNYFEHLKQKYSGIINVKHKVDFRGKFSWHLTWFTHETFDIGQSDEEALLSFNDYVETIQNHNYNYDEFTESAKRIPLMGAEDTWRWHGMHPLTGERATYGGDYPAPCRCVYCRQQGLIRMCH